MKKNVITGILFIGVAVASFLIGTTQAKNVAEVNGNDYINMQEVVDFETDGDGLYITLSDGNGYYWKYDNK